jgi:hypothetical protein
MLQLEYTNKPSIVTLRAAIKKALAMGETWMQFTWGENQITLEHGAWGWSGHGWIGKHGGQDLAQEINKTEKAIYATR